MAEMKVLVTAAGASVIEGTIYSLKNNPDGRTVKVVGVDNQESVAGKYLCDAFYKVPSKLDGLYVDAILEVCDKEKVNVVLPIWSDEIELLAEHKSKFTEKGIGLALADLNALKTANNKFTLFNFAKKLGVPVPESYLVNRFDDLRARAESLGYPNKQVVVKQPFGSGERGFRIIKEVSDRKKDFYHKKPQSSTISLDELYSILGSEFEHLIISEFLPGKEYTVDCFRNNKINVAIPRTRDFVKLGVSFEGTLEKHDKIIEYSKLLAEKLGLEYCFGFQFKLDAEGIPKIIECNPRVQGGTVTSTFGGANLIYSAVKHALGETVEIKDIDWGAKMLRYFGTVGLDSLGKRIN